MKKDFVSLAEARPDLAKEWNYEKNGDLKPKDVSCGSNKKVWWKLPYDVPDDYPVEHLRGKHFDFEWEASIGDRTRGVNCPFLCQNPKTWKGFNDLATTNPSLAGEWDYKLNIGLTPSDVTANSGKNVWWHLQYDIPNDYMVENLRGKRVDFRWQAAVSDRNNGNGCPFLAGKAVWPGFNDLRTTNPELAKQWHPTKNGELTAVQVTASSNKKIWWLLPYDVPMEYSIKHLRGKHFDFEWKTTINHRTGNYGTGCPYLNGKAVWPGFNDLQTTNPELAKQWHPTKNGELTAVQVTASSSKKVWWLYPYDDPKTGKHFDFEWEAIVSSRNKGTGCPFLTGKAVWSGFNDLQTVNPELAKQWHPTKNGCLKPTQVTANAGKKVWWLLSYDVPMDYSIEYLRGKHFNFEWKSVISSRNSGIGCPYLNGQAVCEGFNDLQTVNPELAGQWHPTKNGDLKPTQVTANTSKKVWWLYSYDVPKDYSVEHLRGKRFNFEWQAAISKRNEGHACPFVCGQAVCEGFNDLKTVNPELAKQWHPTKNGCLKPTQVTANTGKKVWWLLSYDVPIDYSVKHLRGRHFNFEWRASIVDRNKNQGCPYLSGQAVWEGFNDLETVNPSLAKLWHPTKNGKLKPTQVTINSTKMVWWMYPYDDLKTGKHFDFEWQSSIVTQNTSKRYCPYLSNQAIWKGFNDLQTINPRLALQWHPTKNGDLKPEQVTSGSRRKVWWLLPYDDKKTGMHYDFEWQASISNRARGANCPFLITYRGENYIKQYLQKNNISFNTQKKFSDLFGIGDGQLSYDFSISNEKYEYILIEYNGIQHYEANDFFGGKEQFKKQKEHDKRKRDYAKKHGYKLITVKYTYDTYESVEEYLDKELKKLGVINDTKKEEPVNDAA